MRTSSCLTLNTVAVLFLMLANVGYCDDDEILQRIALNFVRVRGMKMDQYNHFWTPLPLEDCLMNCVHAKDIICRSFSYSSEAKACLVYENARDSAPAAYYNPPGTLADDPYGNVAWDYFERKSDKYREMESKVNRLQNLTEISLKDAQVVMTSLTNALALESLTEGPSGGGSSLAADVSPSELEIAGDTLLTVIKLNPIQNASVEGIEEFTKVVANVSSLMVDPSFVSVWKMVQKNPGIRGSSGIIDAAENLCKEASELLLAAGENVKKSITAEAESIAFWMDVFDGEFSPRESFLPRSAGQWSQEEVVHEEHYENHSSESHQSQQFRQQQSSQSSSTYTFPNHDQANEGQQQVSTSAPNYSTLSTYATTSLPDEQGFLDDSISLPRKALGSKSVVINVRYKNLNRAMPTRKNDDKPERGKTVRSNAVNSAVLTTTVLPPPSESVFRDQPVIIVFRHDREARGNVTGLDGEVPPLNGSTAAPEADAVSHSEENLHCVYWDTESDEDAGAWSTKGCAVVETNKTHTVCSCFHLTSFAVLLQIVDYRIDDDTLQSHLQALSIISKVGCVLSLLGVTVMCAAFIKLKFHTENMKIHFNLGVAVGLADLVFLFEELAESNRTCCVIVTILLYYFYMSVLAWMLIEGIHLYSQVVVVFVSARRWVKYYISAGWAMPLGIMAIAMGTLNVKLGNQKICWLSPQDNSIWAFAAPASLVILINTVILVAVVRVIISIQPNKSSKVKLAKFRNAVKGSIFLFPLLGTTWLFGLLCLSQETLLFQYLFATANSLQGFFLFVFHCLCNSEVRESARRHKWIGTAKSTPNLRSRGENSGLFGLSVANGLKRFRNSVSFEIPSVSSANASDSGNDANDARKINGRRLKRITSVFPQFFKFKLPATISEEGEKYASTASYDPSSTSTSANTTRPSSRGTPVLRSEKDIKEELETLERTVPLPGMPVKNDIIRSDYVHMTLPKEAQSKLDKMLADHIAKNIRAEDEGKLESKDELLKEEEDRKMKMSYDSGLNSIDNESILDEEDEVWMASQMQTQEQNDTRTCNEGTPL